MKRISTLVLGTAIALSGTLNAQENKMNTVFNEVDATSIRSHNSNPWGLVYRGAIEKNESGKVNNHQRGDRWRTL